MLRSADSAKLVQNVAPITRLELKSNSIVSAVQSPLIIRWFHRNQAAVVASLASRLKRARIAFTTLGRMSRLDCERDDEHLFHHRALDENRCQICRPPSEVDVDLLVDVRSSPRSRTNPQFNLETSPRGWRPGKSAIGIAELGGLSGQQRFAESSLTLIGRCGASGTTPITL